MAMQLRMWGPVISPTRVKSMVWIVLIGGQPWEPGEQSLKPIPWSVSSFIFFFLWGFLSPFPFPPFSSPFLSQLLLLIITPPSFLSFFKVVAYICTQGHWQPAPTSSLSPSPPTLEQQVQDPQKPTERKPLSAGHWPTTSKQLYFLCIGNKRPLLDDTEPCIVTQ